MHDFLKKSLVLLPLAVMLVSGCTIPGTDINIDIPGFGTPTVSYQNEMLVITSLQAIPAEVAPGQTVTLVATIQNKGTQKRSLSEVYIDLYDYCPGLFQKSIPDKITGDIYPDQMIQVVWKLKAADNLAVESTCPSDGMKVAVRYKQKTDSIATIAFIDEMEMNRLIQEGKFGKTTSAVTVGEGPVKPYVEVRDVQPIPSNSKTTNIIFRAENKGQGFVQRIEGDEINPTVTWDSVSSSSSVMKADLEKCKAESNDQFILIRGKSAEIPCTVAVPVKDTPEYTETITTTISYNYEFRKSVIVKVKPKR